MKLLYGKSVSDKIKISIKSKLKKSKTKPVLGVFRIGDDKANIAYEKSILRTSQELKIKVEVVALKCTSTLNKAKNALKDLSDKKNVKGIIVLKPFSKDFFTVNKKSGRTEKEIEEIVIDALSKEKDIDGIKNVNSQGLYDNNISEKFIPCTPLAVLKILLFNKVNLKGKNVVIVGRSKTVGKPLALLLLNSDATVTIAHSKTKNLKKITKGADILICAIGIPNFITNEYVNKNQIVIDVGINVVNKKIVGDVFFEDVKEKVKALTPVPTGVGDVTNIVLFEHLVL